MADDDRASAAPRPRRKQPRAPKGRLREAASRALDLTTAENIVADLIRLYWKVDQADHRLAGELADKQIKISRILLERLDRADLVARIEKLETSNRELESKLIGGTSGNPVTRADSAPTFVVPTSRVPH